MSHVEGWAEFLAATVAVAEADRLVEQAQHALAHAKNRQRQADRREEQAWDMYLRSGR
jgi:hypothetical protein